MSNGRKPTEVSFLSQPAFRTQPGPGTVLAVLNCSVGSADLWQEGFALVGVLQTFGQQHFAVCSGQLWPSAVAFQPALSRSTESVAPKLNATNTSTVTTVLRNRCMPRMLKPEAQRSKTILCSVWLSLYFATRICVVLRSLLVRPTCLRLMARTLDNRDARVFREVRITG